MPQVADFVVFLERFAPSRLAEDWDNVGLLVGDRTCEAPRVMTCLTLTPDVAREAIDSQAALVVTHHPVLFRAVQRLTADDPHGKMLLDLISAGVAVYSPHTSFDSARDGINQQLAQMLGLEQIEPLRPEKRVGEALAEPRTAEPHGLAGASPSRLPDSQAGEPLTQSGLVTESEPVGTGRVGLLTHLPPEFDTALQPRPAGAAIADPKIPSLHQFLSLVEQKLAVRHLQYVGDQAKPVRRVAIACGAGGDLLPVAMARQCDVLLTGEARFHTCLGARAAGIALVLAGHYATERPGIEQLARIIQQEFPGATVWASKSECDPLQSTG